MIVCPSIEELIRPILRWWKVSEAPLASAMAPGGLEAAAARPQTGYYVDIVEGGAALCESLLQNRPFV